MIEHPRSLDDGEEGRGSVNAVLRLGDEVLRPMGDWSPAVHDVLVHLQAQGFRSAPRFLGIDGVRGKERLSYIHGEVAMRPWPGCLLADTGLEQIGSMLRCLHAILGKYRPPAKAKWRDPTARWGEGMIVRHGDLGPWNMVWDAGRLVGVIDWDLAEPGDPLDDLAQAAWYCIPLRPRKGCEDAGVDMRRLGDRLTCLSAAYGVHPDQVIEALIALEAREIERTARLAAQGIEPWVAFCNRGDVDDIKQELQWLQSVVQSDQQGARVDALRRATQLER